MEKSIKSGTLCIIPFTAVLGMLGSEVARRKLEGKQMPDVKEQLVLSMPGAADCVISLAPSEALFWHFYKTHNTSTTEAAATLNLVKANLELSCSGAVSYSLKPPAKGRKSGKSTISATIPLLTNLRDLDAWTVLKTYRPS